MLLASIPRTRATLMIWLVGGSIIASCVALDV
jgi:hypothetical protein